MSYKAIHKFAHISAQKVRPFADIIRGQYALEAVDALKFFPNRGARMLEKVLKSAIANAEDRHVTDLDTLVVVDARVDGGPRMIKRMRPKSRGMASVIVKEISHLSVTLESESEIDAEE